MVQHGLSIGTIRMRATVSAISSRLLLIAALSGLAITLVGRATAQEVDVEAPGAGVPAETPPEIQARIDALQAARDAADAATLSGVVELPSDVVLPEDPDRLPSMDSGDPNPDRINAPSRFDTLAAPEGG